MLRRARTCSVIKSLTFKYSGCRCPSVGIAMALSTLSETLEGPGPIRVLSGTSMGDPRDEGGGSIEVKEDMAVGVDGRTISDLAKMCAPAAAAAVAKYR